MRRACVFLPFCVLSSFGLLRTVFFSFTTRHDDIHGLHELLYCATRTHVFVSIINAPPLPVPARCV